MSSIGPETHDDGQRFLKELDEELYESSGQTVAWLSVENQIESHRFPGPSTTKNYYYLNIGLLPQEAYLRPHLRGSYKLPIEKAVSVPFWNPLDDELSWDMDLHYSLDRGIVEPEMVIGPEVYTSSSKEIALYAGGNLGVVPIPRPVIGNAAVEELFDKHKLEEVPTVVNALEVLTASVKGQAN